jgi:hypothetical protein
VLLGYVGHSVPWVKWAAYSVAGIAVAFSVAAPLVGYVRRRMGRGRRHDSRAEQGDT